MFIIEPTMTLFEYLSNHYYDQTQLLQSCQVDEETLLQWQEKGLFPKPAYRLNSEIECSSYYGLHKCTEYWDYFARGYDKWAKLLLSQTEISASKAYEIFYHKYCNHLSLLAQQGLYSQDECFNDDLHEHVQNQWQHFLNGKFGLITQNGLIEEIVEVELAINIISTVTELNTKKELDDEERQIVRLAIKKLSKSLSHFAPHERKQSYRTRFIDNTIKLYNLKA